MLQLQSPTLASGLLHHGKNITIHGVCLLLHCIASGQCQYCSTTASNNCACCLLQQLQLGTPLACKLVMSTMLSVLPSNCSLLPAAKRSESDRKASSKKAHANYADDGQEKQASKLTVEVEAKGDVEEAVAEGDKAADKIQAQVDKEDGDFDPDAAEDEVEAVPADEADDAGKLHQASSHAVLPIK